MANSKSALKRVRQTERRTARNRIAKARVKLLYREIVEALESKESAEVIKDKFSLYSSSVDKAVKKNIYHRNKGANLKRAMARAIKNSLAA